MIIVMIHDAAADSLQFTYEGAQLPDIKRALEFGIEVVNQKMQEEQQKPRLIVPTTVIPPAGIGQANER